MSSLGGVQSHVSCEYRAVDMDYVQFYLFHSCDEMRVKAVNSHAPGDFLGKFDGVEVDDLIGKAAAVTCVVHGCDDIDFVSALRHGFGIGFHDTADPIEDGDEGFSELSDFHLMPLFRESPSSSR